MTTRKRKAEEVEPTLIEPPRILTGAEEWLRDQRERVERLAREYSPHEITTAQDYRDSKRARTAARKAIKEVEDSRREQVGAIKDAVREFEAEVRDLLAPLSGVDEGYRDAIRAWESLVVESRLQAIEAWYVEEGGVVVEAVPFSRILDRWGAEGKWQNYGTNEVAIKEDLTRRVRSIEADLTSIDAQHMDDEERMALKQDYLSTLDMSEAMGRAAERRRQREALEEDARRRREAEEAERARREAAERERAEEEAAERAREEARRADALAEAQRARMYRMAIGQDAPDPTPTSDPYPDEEEPTRPAPEPGQAPGPARTLVFEVTVPEPVVGQFVAAMRAIDGVHGRKVGER